MTAWCDNTGETLAVKLRTGSAGSNTVADHLAVLTAAIAQIPVSYRRDLLITCDRARGDQGPPGAHHDRERRPGRRVHYSVGFDLDERARTAITAVPHSLWQNVIDATPGRLGQLAFWRPATGAHTRVQDNIRDAKSTGLEHLPSTHCALNQAWCIGRRRRGRLARVAPPGVLPGPWNRRPPGTTAGPPARTTPRERG